MGTAYKLGIVLAVQVAAVIILICFSAEKTDLTSPSETPHSPYLLKNCRAQKKITSNGNTYDLTAKAETVNVTNSNIAIFKSYANRRLEIEGLAIEISQKNTENPPNPNRPAPGGSINPVVEFEDKLRQSYGKWGIDGDFSNLFSVFIRDFNCKIAYSGKPKIQISSLMAEISDENLTVLLEGNVRVRLSNGKELFANKVKWLVIDDTFKTKGSSLLVDNDKKIGGSDLTLKY